MRDTVQVSWGSAVQTEGTAGTETLDSIHLCSYSAPCFYRLFLVSYFSYFKNKTRWAALYSLHKTFSPCYFFLHSNSLRWRAWKLPPGCKSRNWDWEERSYSLVRLERKLRSFDSKGRIFFFFWLAASWMLYCDCLAHERWTSFTLETGPYLSFFIPFRL